MQPHSPLFTFLLCSIFCLIFVCTLRRVSNFCSSMPVLFSDGVSAGRLLLLLSYSYCHKAEVLACFWWLSTQVRLSIYRDIPSYNVCSHLHFFMVIARACQSDQRAFCCDTVSRFKKGIGFEHLNFSLCSSIRNLIKDWSRELRLLRVRKI